MFDFINAMHCKFKEEEDPPPSENTKQVAYLIMGDPKELKQIVFCEKFSKKSYLGGDLYVSNGGRVLASRISDRPLKSDWTRICKKFGEEIKLNWDSMNKLHAEVRLICYFIENIEYYNESFLYNSKVLISLFSYKSPCTNCTGVLELFVRFLNKRIKFIFNIFYAEIYVPRNGKEIGKSPFKNNLKTLALKKSHTNVLIAFINIKDEFENCNNIISKYKCYECLRTKTTRKIIWFDKLYIDKMESNWKDSKVRDGHPILTDGSDEIKPTSRKNYSDRTTNYITNINVTKITKQLIQTNLTPFCRLDTNVETVERRRTSKHNNVDTVERRRTKKQTHVDTVERRRTNKHTKGRIYTSERRNQMDFAEVRDGHPEMTGGFVKMMFEFWITTKKTRPSFYRNGLGPHFDHVKGVEKLNVPSVG